MIKNNFEYIVIGLLVIVFLQPFFSVPSGISEAELEYQLQLDSLKGERIKDLERINELQIKNQVYENIYDSIKNDVTIDTISSNKLQSLLSRYANSRR